MARVSVSRVVQAPQHDIWALLSDVANAGRWNKAWTEVELTSPQTHGVGTTFATHTESGDIFEFEVCEWVAPERISFCPVREAEDPGYSITLEAHTFQLRAAGDDATTVELIASAKAHGFRGNLIATFFWPGHQKAGLNLALENVARIFEEIPTDEEQDSGLETLTE